MNPNFICIPAACESMRQILSVTAAAALLTLTAGSAQSATINTQWDFNDSGNLGTSVANVGGHTGTFIFGVDRSANAEGVSGTPGDYALALSGAGAGAMMDATTPGFMAALNALTGTQSMSITYWQNLNAITDSTSFWGQSPSVIRGLNAHSPWSDGNTYFDTSGCCIPGVHRLSGPLGPTIGDWELMTMIYDNGTKSIYRGTTLIASGSGFLPLVSDHTNFYVANESATHTLNPNGRFDNFTLWNGALTPAEIAVLAVRPVPEPSVALFASATALLGAARRRRQRQ
jgi:hypothetical protein